MTPSTPPDITRDTVDGQDLSGWCRLDHLGVIRAEGADAVRFLQGQLTQDVALLAPGQARLAAFCSAKGRMQASFVVLKRSETELLLVCSADLLAQTLKRLSLFVLRAQVRLSDASVAWQVRGLVGDSLPPGLPSAVWSTVETGLGTVVRLWPADARPRAMLLSPADAPEPGTTPLRAGVWDWLEVRSGVAMITQPLFEAFVPQMLNYESVGGVSFKKGCYPGQEVVARSQFRGTLKRRAFLVRGEAPMTPGQEVFQSTDPEQPCGLVAAAALRPDGQGFEGIVSMQTSAAAAGSLHLDSGGGASLGLMPLPYPLLDDI